MKSIILMTFLCVFSGGLICIQSAMSGQISKSLDNPYMASFSIYFASAVIMGIFLILNSNSLPTFDKIDLVPKYLWIVGAICSCVALSTIYWLMPFVGIPKIMVGVIVGQVIVSLIIGHYGLFGLPKDVLNAKKIIGSLLLISGVVLINIKGNI